MAEPNPGGELDQAGLDRRGGGVRRHTEQAAREPDPGRVADRVGGRDLQHPPGSGRQVGDLPAELLLDATRERMRGPAGWIVVRQFPQCQRVPARFAEHPFADPIVQRPSHHRSEQLAGLGVR